MACTVVEQLAAEHIQNYAHRPAGLVSLAASYLRDARTLDEMQEPDSAEMYREIARRLRAASGVSDGDTSDRHQARP
jgi:hypothetical protein